MQTHLRKYICSTGRKEASRSECYETLNVGLSRLECVTPALLEHCRRRGAILSLARHAEYEIFSRLVVQSSADTLRDSIKNDRDGDNSRSYSFAPPSGIDRRVDTATTMLSALSHGKFDNFQPFAPTRTWAQLWLMILPRQTHSASLFSCVTSYTLCTIRRY